MGDREYCGVDERGWENTGHCLYWYEHKNSCTGKHCDRYPGTPLLLAVLWPESSAQAARAAVPRGEYCPHRLDRPEEQHSYSAGRTKCAAMKRTSDVAFAQGMQRTRMRGWPVGLQSLVMVAADVAAIALGAVIAFRISGKTNQVALQLPVAVILTLVSFWAWTVLLRIFGPSKLQLVGAREHGACLVAFPVLGAGGICAAALFHTRVSDQRGQPRGFGVFPGAG